MQYFLQLLAKVFHKAMEKSALVNKLPVRDLKAVTMVKNGMSLRAPLSAKQMYTTQSWRFQEKHLLGKKQISASAPRTSLLLSRTFREGRANNEITPRPLKQVMDSSPRQQIRPLPVDVRESHSHEPLTPREDRGRCPRQNITPTTTKQNHSQVVTPIARPLREHSEPPVSSGTLGVEVKVALAEITSLLNNIVQRVERMETELQQQHSTSCLVLVTLT